MERDLVRWLCERLPAHPRMLVGPGDDAAILRLSEQANLVATTDMLMDGVDFELARHEPERVGRKALAVNLSDLAAMAAAPVAALVSLALPRRGGEELAKQLYEGMVPLAAEFDCPIAGGDTNSWDGPLVISVTVLGEVPLERRWRRSGARPGDVIVVTGSFGGSILGKQFSFRPRVRDALRLAEQAEIHAAIDVSDGLSLDLSRLCEASGCGAAIDLATVPVAAAAEELARQKKDGVQPIDHALADGEDFELILAIPVESAKSLLAEQPLTTPLTMIGSFISEPGLFAVGEDMQFHPLSPRGYEHRLDSTMNELVFDAADESDTDRFGAALAAALPTGTTVALCGTLGAGKTRLVQAIAAACGVPREEVVSPTFVLCQQYRGMRTIYHLDAYRLHDEDEFRELGVEELFNSDAMVIVEWADRVAHALPDDYLQIEIEITGPLARRFVVRLIGMQSVQILATLAASISTDP